MSLLIIIDNFLQKQEKCPPGEHKHPGIQDCHPVPPAPGSWHKDPKVRHTVVSSPQQAPVGVLERRDMKPVPEGIKITPSGVRIPPNWRNVRIAVNKNAPLQAVGIDAKGRRQYLYSQKHSEKAAESKFNRMKKFGALLPNIRAKIDRDIRRGNEFAEIIYLVDKTGFRIGSNRETLADKKAYGASTLLGKHVRVVGDEIFFDFTGKKGVQIQKTVSDPVLAKIVSKRKRSDSQPLFGVEDSDIRKYMHKIAGNFTVKDFRTWYGTEIALETMKRLTAPETKSALLKAKKAVAKVVAQFLGNTASVALSSYIAPFVFAPWEANLLAIKPNK